MKWIKIKEKALTENYVEIHYREVDHEMELLVSYLQKSGILLGKKDGQVKKLLADDIFYCEIVDRKCFAYLEQEVWILEPGLQEILSAYEAAGFVRIGKSMIVNIHKVDRMESDLNMRVRLYLENGETVILNRSYRQDFYTRLKKEVERNATD